MTAHLSEEYSGEVVQELDVEPIPFYPDDLPSLELDEFGWTQAELDDATRQAYIMLARQANAGKWAIRFPDHRPLRRNL